MSTHISRNRGLKDDTTPHHVTSTKKKKPHRRTRNPHIISQSSSTHTSDTVKEGIIATVNNLQVQLVSRGKQSGSLLDLSVLVMKFFLRPHLLPAALLLHFQEVEKPRHTCYPSLLSTLRLSLSRDQISSSPRE